MTTLATRPPAVAGTFYPGDPGALAETVDACLQLGARHAAGSQPLGGAGARRIKAIVAPHAGYRFSGPIAGSAYAALRDQAPSIRRVVLLGPSHRVWVDGLAVTGADQWSTPLGSVPVDIAARRRLVDAGLAFVDDDAHAEEHSLEVHLPFLQRALGSFELLPLVVGRAEPLAVANVLDAVWGGPETLIVVSSDLSHYLDHATATRVDRATAQLVVAGDLAHLDSDRACGAVPVRGLLLAAKEHRLRGELIDLRTSGDTSGDRDRVVGYGAFAFTESDEPLALTTLARQAIRRALVTGRPHRSAVSELPVAWREPRAVFVTLHRRGALRGCIGTLEASEPLGIAVARAAFGAAFDDPRFAPVTAAEFAELDVVISVLDPPEPLVANSFAELRAALRHGDGLVVTAPANRATFLPAVWDDVADADEFLALLWRKAGLAPGAWPAGMVVERYRATVYAEG